MSLRDIVSTVEGQERSLTVYAPPEKTGLANELEEYFTSQHVSITFRACEADEQPRAELAGPDSAERLVAVELSSLERLVGGDPPEDPCVGARPYAPLLAHLDEATFTSYDHEQMLTTTREIEDRAWRAGEGHLVAGFQQFSNFRSQVEAYRTLGETDLDIDIYAAPDVDPPEGPYTLHATTDPDITETWFVAFDGDGDPGQASALVAEERAAGEFYGFWTYDKELVDSILDAVAGRVVDFEAIRQNL
jgi:DICT domain-containing protein